MDADGALSAYLEVARDGSWTAHVLDLPGCVAFGRSREATLDALARDVDDYLAWLRRHGETVPAVELPVTLAIAEVVERVSPARASGEKVATFGPDYTSLTEDEVRQRLRLMHHARSDLLALLEALPLGGLDLVVPGGDRTVRQVAQHVGQAECWYLIRLSDDEDAAIAALYDRLDSDLVSALGALQSEAERRIGAWTPETRAAIHTPKQFTRYGDEVWTARKVLRRFIEHQREHLAELRGIRGTITDAGSPE